MGWRTLPSRLLLCHVLCLSLRACLTFLLSSRPLLHVTQDSGWKVLSSLSRSQIKFLGKLVHILMSPFYFLSPKDLNLIHVIQFNTEGKRRSYFHSINLRLTLNISTLAHSLCDSYHGHSQPQAGKGEKESCNLI